MKTFRAIAELVALWLLITLLLSPLAIFATRADHPIHHSRGAV